jgi:hypothetical protein
MNENDRELNGTTMTGSLQFRSLGSRRRDPLLANFPHLPQRFDQVLPERFGRSFRVRDLRFDTELDEFVTSEI